jgi:hypothetical protein
MADPEARVVVTARDATGAAFASSNRNLKSFVRGAMQLRTALAGFGVVLSGRAFANWMTNAVQTTDAVGEQKVAVEQAKKAFEAFKKSSDQLAESFAVHLTPSVNLLARALDGLRKVWAPTETEALNEQIKRMQDEINRLTEGIVKFESGDFWYKLAGKEVWDNSREKVEKLRVELEKLYAVRDKPAPTESFEQFLGKIQYDEEMRRLAAEANLKGLEEIDPKAFAMPKELRRDFDFAAAAAAVLNTELQEVSGALVKMPEDLKKFSSEFNAFVGGLEFEQIETEADKTARAIGDDFRDAFANWLTDGEFRFKDFLKNIAAQWISSRIFSDLGKLGGSGSIFSKLFGGGRAEGGPVSSGKAYVVGERGPEWFLPGQSGMVAPMAAGGGVVIHQHFNVEAGLPPQWSAQLSTAANIAARSAYDAVTRRQRGER